MKVRVLGCSGAIAKDCRTTSFLLDQDVLVDAGTGVGDLELDEMVQIDDVLLTHSHLDHVAALPLMIDAIASKRKTPVRVHALPGTIAALKAHVFNNVIWPDFSRIPTPEKPFITFHEIQVGQTLEFTGKRVEVLPAVHTVPAVGYAVTAGRGCWVFTGDTERNPAFWRRINQMNIAALIIETAFSNREKDLAQRSLHLSPMSLAEELDCIDKTKRFPIYITHTKPAETELIMAEIQRFDQTQPFGPNVAHDIRWLHAGQEFFVVSAVLRPGATEKDSEQAFYDSQMLPPEKRGVSFEALFFRQLQQVTTRIHDTENLDQIMLEVSQDICRLLNADRLTLYAVNEDRTAIVSKIKTGLNASRDLKLPISAQSIAGYVAFSKQPINIADVYDDAALKRMHPTLTFLKEVDKRSGYRTKQMLVVPILDGESLHGVLQVINNKSDQPFGELEVEGAAQLCKTLATAIRQRMQKAEEGNRRKVTKYDGLVADGVLTAEELEQCIQQAREEAKSVEHMLMAQYQIRPAQIGPSLAKFFGMAYEPFNSGRIRSEMLHGPLKREFLIEQGWIPVEESPEGLVVMCVDPEAVRGSRIVPQVFPRVSKFAYRVTTLTEFEETLSQLYGAGVEGGTIDELLADLSAPIDDGSNEDSSALESAAADNELVKFVNKVIIDAYNLKASDIHIEPLPGKAKTGIRLRIDGSLQPYIEVPAHFRQAMITRLKIMCDLDISEKRKPQDGKIKFKKFGPLDIELRVATIPSAGGVEDIVMRILAAGEPIPLEKLGLTQHNRERVEKTVSKPYGLFYVCGPTGSGKTTTLHSILKFLNTPDTKIWTAEDPVEITQKGLRQVQINKKAGIDFALVMRAFLRADPDIIMVGESRDKETVSMGVEASLTGHLVFSTLHTNSAPESITRLLDMGMDPFNFADALLGILAQRLAKRLCDCREAYTPDADELKTFVAEYAEDLRHTASWKADYAGEAKKLYEGWMSAYGEEGKLRFYRPVGCDKCNKTGYKGRIGLHELLIADDQVKKLIQERARVSELFVSAVGSGMRTLKMDGMEKIMMGLTDIKQVRSVCIK